MSPWIYEGDCQVYGVSKRSRSSIYISSALEPFIVDFVNTKITRYSKIFFISGQMKTKVIMGISVLLVFELLTFTKISICWMQGTDYNKSNKRLTCQAYQVHKDYYLSELSINIASKVNMISLWIHADTQVRECKLCPTSFPL